MPVKSKKSKIKTKISKYIFKKGDICCEEDFERDKIIDNIFNIYKEMSSKSYLDSINNDIIVFLGYLIDLTKTKDKEGVKLWNYFNEQMPNIKDKKKDEKNIKTLLKSLPLFYLLSFLGSAHYKLSN